MNRYLCASILLLLALRCSPSPAEAPKSADTTSTAVQVVEKHMKASLPYEVRQGKQIYSRFCSICHGEQGGGDGFNAYNLDPKPHSLADSVYITALSDETLRQVISFGGRGVNKSVLMPAYQHTLNRSQINYLIRFIRDLHRQPETEE